MNYRTPVAEIAFALEHIAEATGATCDPDLMRSLISEAGKFADDVIAPLNQISDKEGCQLSDAGEVKTPTGFPEAYRRFVEGGWGGVSAPANYGGQNLPYPISIAAAEIWDAACMAFGLAPILTQSAVEALTLFGSEEQKRLYLPKLVSGEWTGTMNLTEPQAGSDVGALTTKAAPAKDGAYKIKGTKIFISFGEHDLTKNIIHLVLARLPDAPVGTKGVSLFLVPKILQDGARNDLLCIGLEEKMGIHGSPTCVMRYGEKEGAVGFLIGEAHGGMRAMFSMMNPARLQVGMQGVAQAERAFQQALAFARERRQGRRPDTPAGEAAPIIQHPDVARMLLTMKSLAEAGRALAYANAAAMEKDPSRAALLTPLSKAWCSDMGVKAASLGVQVHGGMGFIEETGAAQLMRDARIAPIYEGANGIQANDLLSRKVLADDGKAMRGFLKEMKETARQCQESNHRSLQTIGRELDSSRQSLEKATVHMLREGEKGAMDNCLAGAASYLRLAGNSAGGFYLAKGGLRAHQMRNGGGEAFLAERLRVARFYAESVLPLSPSLAKIASSGAGALEGFA